MPSDVKRFEMRGKMSWQLLAPRRRRGGDALPEKNSSGLSLKRRHLKRKGSSSSKINFQGRWLCFRDGDGGKLLIFLLFWVGTNDLRWVVFKRLYVFVNWGLKNWLIEIERWFFEFGFLVVLCQTLILSIHPCLLHFNLQLRSCFAFTLIQIMFLEWIMLWHRQIWKNRSCKRYCKEKIWKQFPCGVCTSEQRLTMEFHSTGLKLEPSKVGQRHHLDPWTVNL